MLKCKSNKGITMITLIITIVVLLIIAGVTISTLTGDSGVIKQSQSAKEETEKSDVTEAIGLIMAEWYKTGYIGSTKFETFLNEKIVSEEIDSWKKNDDDSYDIEINGYVGTVTEEDGLRGDVQKKGVRPEVTGYTITTASGSTVAQYSQVEGTPLYVTISATMEGGYIESYSPSQTVEVLKNGTCTFTITGVADGESSSITYSVVIDKYILAAAPTGVSFDSTSGSMDLSLQTTMQLNPIIEASTANRETGITWTSSNSDVAEVNTTGLITGKTNGTTVIKAETENGRIAEYTLLCYTTPTGISVSPSSGTLDLSSSTKTIQLVPTIEPSTANTNIGVTYTSTNENVATVSSSGLITGKANGSATITATTGNGYSATCTTTCWTSITGIKITPESSTVNIGGTLQLNATVTPTTTTEKVTWTSSNTSVATVNSSTGLVTGVKAGTVTITAKNPAGTIKSTSTVIVNTAPVIGSVSLKSKTTSSITINAKATDADGDKLTYTLYTGTSSDNLTLQTSSAETTQGTQVAITQSGLSQYTTYYYQIQVTDGKATVTGDILSVRTYCPGNTLYCTAGYKTYPTCTTCGGSGTISQTCSACGGAGGHDVLVAVYYDNGYYDEEGNYNPMGGEDYNYEWEECPTCRGTGKTSSTCTTCSGSGSTTSYHYCSHGYSSSHYYCEHGKTSQHD